MRKSNFALRLQPSLLKEARKVADAEGVALNQLINVAVAEKLSALRIEDYFSERAARADITKALKILKRAGLGKAPMKGDAEDDQSSVNFCLEYRARGLDESRPAFLVEESRPL